MPNKYVYRLARLQDIDHIRQNEESFCSGSDIPPEVAEGINLFLQIDGQILLQEIDDQITSAFWIIATEKLIDSHALIESLPLFSPLRKVFDQRLHKYIGKTTYFVHSWTSMPSHGKWLFREVKRILISKYSNAVLCGFVLVTNEVAVRNYLRMGCRIINYLSSLYYQSDAHYLLHFTAKPTQEPECYVRSLAQRRPDANKSFPEINAKKCNTTSHSELSQGAPQLFYGKFSLRPHGGNKYPREHLA